MLTVAGEAPSAVGLREAVGKLEFESSQLLLRWFEGADLRPALRSSLLRLGDSEASFGWEVEEPRALEASPWAPARDNEGLAAGGGERFGGIERDIERDMEERESAWMGAGEQLIRGSRDAFLGAHFPLPATVIVPPSEMS